MADIVEKLNQSIAFFEQPPPPKIAPPIWPIDHALRECRAEIERLRARNAALVEIVRDSPCPRDRAYITVGNCQQCGCSHGLLIGPLEQKARPEPYPQDEPAEVTIRKERDEWSS